MYIVYIHQAEDNPDLELSPRILCRHLPIQWNLGDSPHHWCFHWLEFLRLPEINVI